MNTVWLIVAVAFGIAELMTTSLTLVWFSIGALILMVLSTFIESIIIQIAFICCYFNYFISCIYKILCG